METGSTEEFRSIISGILRNTRVVDPVLEQSVAKAASETWSDIRTEGEASGIVEVRQFHRGVLHLALDCHARVSEARGFLYEEFRKRINERLEGLMVGKKAYSPDRPLHEKEWGMRDALYVSKIVFQLRGTR